MEVILIKGAVNIFILKSHLNSNKKIEWASDNSFSPIFGELRSALSIQFLHNRLMDITWLCDCTFVLTAHTMFIA